MARLLLLCVAALVAAVATATPWTQLDGYTFEMYTAEFRKVYSAAELPARRALFEERLRDIAAHNADSTKGWKHGVNALTDRTAEELRSMKGYHKSMGRMQKGAATPAEFFTFGEEHMTPPVDHRRLPKRVDWRDHGVVSAVKNQGHCGSCWAFAATATMESHVALATGLLFNLSPQQVAACAPNPDQCGGTGGCSGSTAELAFQYVAGAGIVEEYGYGYTAYYGDTGNCDMDGKVPAASVDGFKVLPSNDSPSLMHAVATLGPIAVTVDASAWHLYEGGVFDGCNQTSPDLDHAVVLVGYGTDPKEGDYWLIRNSWSPSWGEKGYIRLKRHSTDNIPCGTDVTPGHGIACKGDDQPQHVCGTCGVLFDSAYPTGAGLYKAGGDHPIKP